MACVGFSCNAYLTAKLLRWKIIRKCYHSFCILDAIDSWFHLFLKKLGRSLPPWVMAPAWHGPANKGFGETPATIQERPPETVCKVLKSPWFRERFALEWSWDGLWLEPAPCLRQLRREKCQASWDLTARPPYPWLGMAPARHGPTKGVRWDCTPHE